MTHGTSIFVRRADYSNLAAFTFRFELEKSNLINSGKVSFFLITLDIHLKINAYAVD